MFSIRSATEKTLAIPLGEKCGLEVNELAWWNFTHGLYF
jgi:hypothetical protein